MSEDLLNEWSGSNEADSGREPTFEEKRELLRRVYRDGIAIRVIGEEGPGPDGKPRMSHFGLDAEQRGLAEPGARPTDLKKIPKGIGLGRQIRKVMSGGVDLWADDELSQKKGYRSAIDREFRELLHASKIDHTKINSTHVLKLMEDLDPIEAPTFGQKMAVLGGAFSRGLQAPSQGLARSMLGKAEEERLPDELAPGADTESLRTPEGRNKLRHTVLTMDDPSIASLGERAHANATRALQSTGTGRTLMMSAELAGALPGLATTGRVLGGGAKAAKLGLKGAGLGKGAFPAALGLHGGLSAADQGVEEALSAAGGGVSFAVLAGGLSKPMQAFLGKFPTAMQHQAVARLAQGTSGGLTFAGADAILHGPDGERALANFLFGLGHGALTGPAGATTKQRAQSIVKGLGRGNLKTEAPVVGNKVPAEAGAFDPAPPKGPGGGGGAKPEAGAFDPAPALAREGSSSVRTPPPVEVRAESGAWDAPPALKAPSKPVKAPEGRLVNATNARMNQERLERQLGEMATPFARRHDAQVVDQALRAVKENPEAARDLSRELRENPRAHNDFEVALLDFRRIELQRAREMADVRGEEAQKRGDKDGIAAARKAAAGHEMELSELDVAQAVSGTETGRALRFRRVLIARDFSVAGIEGRMRRAKNYEGLTKAERTQAAELAERVAKAELEVVEVRKRLAELEAQEATAPVFKRPTFRKPIDPKAPEFGAKNRLVDRTGAEAARAAIRAKLGGRLGAGIDPTLVKEFVKLGTFYIEGGVRTFAQFSKTMVDEFGAKVKPHLREIWDASRRGMQDELQTSALGRLQKKVEAGKSLRDQRGELNELMEGLVNSGVDNPRALVEGMQRLLQRVDPNMSRQEAHEVILHARRATRPEVGARAELNKIKAEMRKIDRLKAEIRGIEEQVAAGKAPRKGLGRRKTLDSAEVSALKERLAAARKELRDAQPKKPRGPTKAEVREKQLEERVKELDRKIAEGDLSPTKRKGFGAEPSKRAEALKRERDQKQKRLDKMRSKAKREANRPAREAAAEARTRKALEARIAELNKKLKTGDVSTTPRKPAKASARVQKLRAERDALNKKLAKARAEKKRAERPSKPRQQMSEARRLKALKARQKKRIAELEEIIRTGEKPQKKSPERIKLDKEAVENEAVLQEKKREAHEVLLEKELANRSTAEKVASGVFIEAPAALRSIMTSLDLSAVGRQGWILGVIDPVGGSKAMGDMFRALRTDQGQARVDAEMRADPAFQRARRAGLEFTEVGAVEKHQMEEAFQSRWAEHAPVAGPFVKASQRAYTTYLNAIRLNRWKALEATWGTGGRLEGNAGHVAANWINAASGRAMAGAKTGKFLSSLALPFFAPRLVWSRFQLIYGQPLWTGLLTGKGAGTARIRTGIALEYARFLMGMAVIYEIAEAAGATVEKDWRSSDFGKIRMGNTRVDPLAGLSQVIVLSGRSITGETKTLSGRVKPLRGKDVGFGDSTNLTVLGRFLRSKAGPVPGLAMDILEQRKVTGEEMTDQDVFTHFMPMIIDDVLDVYKAWGIPEASALALLAFFGVSVHDFEARKSKPRGGRGGRRNGR